MPAWLQWLRELKHSECNSLVTVVDTLEVCSAVCFFKVTLGVWDENIQNISKNLFSSTRLNDNRKEVWVLFQLCSELGLSVQQILKMCLNALIAK